METAFHARRGSGQNDRLVPGIPATNLMNTSSNQLPECRSCATGDLQTILSLGRTPLANSLIAPDNLATPEETYPLDLMFCPACTLVQIAETVSPEKLFREYLYFSSYSDTMLEHA